MITHSGCNQRSLVVLYISTSSLSRLINEGISAGSSMRGPGGQQNNLASGYLKLWMIQHPAPSARHPPLLTPSRSRYFEPSVGWMWSEARRRGGFMRLKPEDLARGFQRGDPSLTQPSHLSSSRSQDSEELDALRQRLAATEDTARQAREENQHLRVQVPSVHQIL